MQDPNISNQLGHGKGVVSALKEEKRFGWIRREGSHPDLFFHFTEIPKGEKIVVGTKLSFKCGMYIFVMICI